MIKKTIQGVEVNYLPVKKYKHMMIVYSFQSKLDEKTYNERHMLPGLLEDHNRVYNNSETYHTHLDMLYGARFNTGVFQRGDLLSTQFMMRIINQKYVQEQSDLLVSAFEFMNNIIFKPKFYNKLLTKKSVLDKLDETKDMLKTIKQDKASLAYFNFMKTIKMKGVPTFYPHEEKLGNVNQSTMTEIYHQLLQDDQLRIYVIGDFDFDQVDQLIKDKVVSRHLSSTDYEFSKQIKPAKPLGDVVAYDDVSIARIYMAYQIHVRLDPDEETKMELLNIIVGGYAQSKMFRTIREDMHLVYYIYSTYLTENDLFFVHFECEEDDVQKSMDAVEDIMSEIKDGAINEDELMHAKLHLIKNYQSMSDSLSGLLKLNITSDLVENQPFSMEDKINSIHSITVESLIEFSKALKKHVSYRFVKAGESND